MFSLAPTYKKGCPTIPPGMKTSNHTPTSSTPAVALANFCCISKGTGAKSENLCLKLARPCESDQRVVEYLSNSASGTRALIT